MLNKLDDFMIHQTPEPIAHPATNDRNVYDRTWFNGFAEDGSYFFGLGIATYPHRGILDCAFSVVRPGGRQHCFFGSRRAPTERTEMVVGPFRIEVIEPMRRTRVILDDNGSGLGCDMIFSARTAPIEEARQTLWAGARRIMDATRFDQFGRWRGVLQTPDGAIAVDETLCRGIKDRSWGVRRVGEPEVRSAPQAPQRAFFIWAPLFWSDHVTHAISVEGPRGEAWIQEGLKAPLYEGAPETPDHEDGKVEHMASIKHRTRYRPGARLIESAEIDLIDQTGATRTLALDPILKFQMKGLGYGHREWGQGVWKGELALGQDSFDPSMLDGLAPENLHVQQLVRATDGADQGIGVLENICVGPYAPAGFTDWFDCASITG